MATFWGSANDDAACSCETSVQVMLTRTKRFFQIRLRQNTGSSMSTPIADTLKSRPNKPPATTIGLTRSTLTAAAKRCFFAWLHQPENACSSGHGVVICPPIGYEQVHSHRSLRHLADAVARAGLCGCVLTFTARELRGTDENSDRVATWLANIHDAIFWMENELGCEQITLFGLRLGATLAVQVAADHAVENLLLWCAGPGEGAFIC